MAEATTTPYKGWRTAFHILTFTSTILAAVPRTPKSTIYVAAASAIVSAVLHFIAAKHPEVVPTDPT